MRCRHLRLVSFSTLFWMFPSLVSVRDMRCDGFFAISFGGNGLVLETPSEAMPNEARLAECAQEAHKELATTPSTSFVQQPRTPLSSISRHDILEWVIEVSYSQKRSDLQRLADDYILGSDGQHSSRDRHRYSATMISVRLCPHGGLNSRSMMQARKSLWLCRPVQSGMLFLVDDFASAYRF